MAKSKAKAKKKVAIIRAIAVLLVLVAVAYVITSLALGKQWNPAKWGKGNNIAAVQPEQDKTEVIAVTSDGKKFLTANSYAMPRAMSFVQKQSTYSKSKEFNVTATLSNQYINGKFDWSVEFVNPASAWATGKVAEYFVQANPTSDGSATATIKYISSFSEPIKVTATLRGSEQSDSCQIDCLKDITMYSTWTDCFDFGDRIEGGCQLSSTAGTIFADYQVLYADFELDLAFIEAVQSYLKFDINLHSYSFTSLITNKTLEVEEQTNDYMQLHFYTDHNVTYADFIENFEAFDDEHKEAVYYAWYHAALDGVGGIQIELGIDGYIYGVKTTSGSGHENANMLTGERYGKDVQPSVTLNQNVNVIF